MKLSELAPGSYKVISGSVPTQTPAPSNPVGDFFTGVGKGGLSTLQNLGSLANTGLNQTVGRAVDALAGKPFTPTDYSIKPGMSSAQVNEKLTPTNDAQKAGKTTEQIAEYFVPAAKAAQAERLVTTLTSGITNSLVKGTANVLGKAAVQGLSAGGVSLAQSADLNQALTTGGIAAGLSAPLGALGEVARGVKFPEWLYQKVFKNSLGDVKKEFDTNFLVKLSQTKPEEYQKLADAGIIQTALGGKPMLNQTTAEKALAKGLKGSINNMTNLLTGTKFQSEYAVQQLAKNSKQLVGFKEPQFMNVLSEIAEDYQNVGFGELSGEAQRLADAIWTGKGKVSAKDALSIRRLLDRVRHQRSFDAPASKLSLTQQNLKTLADSARKRINAVPGMEPLMNEYAFAFEGLEDLYKAARAAGNAKVVGAIDGVILGAGILTQPQAGVGLAIGKRLVNSAVGATTLGSAVKKGLGAKTAGSIGAIAGTTQSALNQSGQ